MTFFFAKKKLETSDTDFLFIISSGDINSNTQDLLHAGRSKGQMFLLAGATNHIPHVIFT